MRLKYLFVILLVVGCDKVSEAPSPVAQSKPKKPDLELQEQCAKHAEVTLLRWRARNLSGFVTHRTVRCGQNCFAPKPPV